MLSRFFRILVAILMTISPTLPHLFSLPAIPSGQNLNLDERFELVWSDEFDGSKDGTIVDLESHRVVVFKYTTW